MRIGIGFDVHILKKGRKLIIGGTEIPFEYGLYGHSDGDVLLHALSDAIAGALSKPDIGTIFPDTDPTIKNISSKLILEKYISFVKELNMKFSNIDIVLIAEEPKLQQWYGKIKEKLSSFLNIPRDCLGIKAKTTEKTGLIGDKKAIACWVAVLLE
ncbi:MAG: 2-C-methyl-D-erythritol 2,4-cyclodiphosphate synthase [Candidatus Omnitrophica bacterium]|nr:2-C-methyl-D-erythritol 2,4-cyclodiphosphate synthase [Candidatus Omnitrophota bacterium]